MICPAIVSSRCSTSIGGGGADTFLIEGAGIIPSTARGTLQADVITDFNSAEDEILFNFDADTTQDGVQVFELVAGFSNTAGEATLTYNGARNTTTLLVDVDGDGKADYSLTVNGDHVNGTDPLQMPVGWFFPE